MNRLWNRVEKTKSCWLWTGGITGRGYGNIQVNYKQRPVHCVAYELLVGPIPEGLMLRHSCDVRHCVNPEHLVPGSHQDNMDDMVSRGRSAIGENHSQAVLTERKVLEIRASDLPSRPAAKEFGVCPATILQIRNRVTWRHI